MDVVFIIVGMNVSILFLFDKSKLDNKEWFFKLLTLNVILFLVALISFSAGFGKNTAINSLFVPLMSQFAYYVLSKLFYLKHKRNSVDTYWTMDRALFLDGWFNSMFWLISILLFLFVL
jgi:nitric oxide reductase large subunit